jgi:hypothetical protein
MWMDKLSDGVLRVVTPLGPRYFRPEFWQRLCLLWMFRHFDTLPLQVLSAREQRLVEELCAEQRLAVAPPPRNGMKRPPILGTVERRSLVLVEPLPERHATERATNAVPPLTPDLQQRS